MSKLSEIYKKQEVSNPLSLFNYALLSLHKFPSDLLENMLNELPRTIQNQYSKFRNEIREEYRRSKYESWQAGDEFLENWNWEHIEKLPEHVYLTMNEYNIMHEENPHFWPFWAPEELFFNKFYYQLVKNNQEVDPRHLCQECCMELLHLHQARPESGVSYETKTVGPINLTVHIHHIHYTFKNMCDEKFWCAGCKRTPLFFLTPMNDLELMEE